MKYLLQIYYRYWAIPKKIRQYKRLLKRPAFVGNPKNTRLIQNRIDRLKFLKKIV